MEAIFQEAVDAVEECGSKAAAARKLGISVTTLKHRYTQGLMHQANAGREVETALERENKRLRAKLKTEQRKYKAALDEINDWEDRFDVCRDLGAAKPIKIKRAKTGRSEASTAILGLTDWHVEERVDPETCSGKNEYNLDIATSRVKHVLQSAVELIESWRKTWPIDELYVAILGDIITGYIHEELEETNYLSPSEALLFAEQLLVDGLEFLLRETGVDRIVVPTCYGNHGRTTKKPRVKTAYANSYEWLLYNFMARSFRHEPRIEFRIAKGYHNFQEIRGQLWRLHHGDFIKYQGGTGGISIPVNKAIAAWNKTRTADQDLFGHWHQWGCWKRWTASGSLIGFNDYSVKIKAEYEEPSQPLLLTSRKYGKVAAFEVFAE